MMIVKAIAIAAVLLAAPEPSQAAGRTIVGTWAPDPAACTPVGGMISIGPMALTGDEISCTFFDVARSGDAVTWHGRCSDGGAGHPATVTAALSGGSLRVVIDARENGPYRRCPTGPALASAAVEPWPGDRWRADVDEHQSGHDLHVTMLGATTTTGKGDSVQVTCTDRDAATGKTLISRHHAWAMARQGDYEGDAGPLGSFGSSDGHDLRWFGASPCASGRISWQRR